MVIDRRLFGLAVAIITGNVIVLVLSILVLAHVCKDNKKSMKTGAVLLFTATELLNVASAIIVWLDSYTFGWSWWVTSWSAVLIICIIALTCLCCCLSFNGDEGESNSSRRFFVYYYVVEID
ncbi:Hypothetical predicted protein [Mytilus galloprovincialis]|uniref:Uncharacterized protein n=1 Tax=Mytilus galloprovincialis TaxID=29158 RepID=A0A8B6ECC3_MYTGA|nr:Hypothetical predicted protein [Mytilus galloprovincialis]